MLDHYLAELWSKYTISPLLHRRSLQQTCAMFIEHYLEPSHIISTGSGFGLHPVLAEPLSKIVPEMDNLIQLSAEYQGLYGPSFIGISELCILTATTSLHVTQNQLILAWVNLITKLKVAMHELKALCAGDHFDSSHRMQSSRMTEVITMLPISLRLKLPARCLASCNVWIPSPRSPTSECATYIVEKTLLDSQDVVDYGSAKDSRLTGQFGLEIRLLEVVKGTVKEMQSLLTSTFSPASGSTACFVVDPHGQLLQTLRGVNSVAELPLVWTALCKRMGLAQTRLTQYQSAESCIPGARVSLTKERPSPPSHLSPPTVAEGSGNRPSVKVLVAAIEAKECSPAQWKHPLSVDLMPSPFEVLKFPAPAVVKNEAQEITEMEIRTMRSVHASSADPPVDTPVTPRLLGFLAPAAFASANSIESGGLRVKMAESRTKVGTAECAGRDPADTERNAWRAAESRLVHAQTAAKLSACCLSSILHKTMLFSVAGSGGRKLTRSYEVAREAAGQQSAILREDSAHTSAQHCLVLPSAIPTSPSTFLASLPLRSLVMDYKDFAFVSARVWTRVVSHLLRILREEFAPCCAWEREGIGTRVRI
ncbi:hypothetical protein K438DRAFT_1772487 [Mycena galopus ATCC 62051]|nr:hypothetical protein K438DRAFT_1772487 [Mycena galopus ATCC 62051]